MLWNVLGNKSGKGGGGENKTKESTETGDLVKNISCLCLIFAMFR